MHLLQPSKSIVPRGDGSEFARGQTEDNNMDDRTNLSGVLDAHYAEFARSIGVSVKQLRTWTAKTKFDAEFLSQFGHRVSCAAVAAFCEPVIKRFGELPTEGCCRISTRHFPRDYIRIPVRRAPQKGKKAR